MIIGSANVATEKVEKQFEKVSTDIFHYVQLGLIKNGDVSVYVKYLELYNPNHGYAYPTLYKLQDWLNLSRTSILNSNKRLVAAGLLEQGKYKSKNNIYKPMQPLSKEELFKQVPDAVKRLEKRQAKISKIESEDNIRFGEKIINHNSKDY